MKHIFWSILWIAILTLSLCSTSDRTANVARFSLIGTLYPNIRITGDFGILEVKKGSRILPPPEEAPLLYRVAEM